MVSSIGLWLLSAETVQEWSRPLLHQGEGFNTIILAALFAVIALAFSLWGDIYSLKKY